MTHYDRARSTGEPTAPAVRLMLGFLVGLVFLNLTLSANAAGGTDTTRKIPPMALYSSWLKRLGSDYKVVQGNVFLFTSTECPPFISTFGTCFGQNPASPYIVPQPPIADSYVNPYYASAFNTPGPHGQTTNIFYRLSDQDALITIVSYPPEAAYFGYLSYLFTGESINYADIIPPPSIFPLFPGFAERTVSPDPNRYSIFGSIGNDVNNVIVQNQLGVSPWRNAIVAYITTSNTNLAAALVESAQEHGIDPKSIFIEPIGSNVITGNGPAADDMVTLMRYAVPESNSDAENWMSSLSRNILVYKVSNPSLAVQRYGENSYTPRIVNNPETTLSTALQQLANLLRKYLTANQSPSKAAYQPFTVTTTVNAEGIPNGGLVGSVCIQYGTNCLGDDQDTSTYPILVLRTLGLEDTAFVVGVNHNVPNINNTRYVSVAVYDLNIGLGVASTSQTNPQAVGFDSGSLNGSAQGILQALGISIPPEYTDLMANLPNLYVTAIARDINNPAIAPARQYTIDLEGTSLVPIDAPLGIIERSYIVPGTTTGGNVDYMLYPVAVAARKDFLSPPSRRAGRIER